MYCKHCQTEKPESAFYVSNNTKCKDCVKASVIANRIAKIDYYRSFDKARASQPHRVAARMEYAKTKAYAESHEAAARRWAAKHPKRYKANIVVGNALRDGKLQKDPCHICGRFDVEGHHPDYDRPLDVVWLCTPHHKEVHAMIKEYA